MAPSEAAKFVSLSENSYSRTIIDGTIEQSIEFNTYHSHHRGQVISHGPPVRMKLSQYFSDVKARNYGQISGWLTQVSTYTQHNKG